MSDMSDLGDAVWSWLRPPTARSGRRGPAALARHQTAESAEFPRLERPHTAPAPGQRQRRHTAAVVDGIMRPSAMEAAAAAADDSGFEDAFEAVLAEPRAQSR